MLDRLREAEGFDGRLRFLDLLSESSDSSTMKSSMSSARCQSSRVKWSGPKPTVEICLFQRRSSIRAELIIAVLLDCALGPTLATRLGGWQWLLIV